MRVPPPRSLRLDRHALLRDVATRLSDRLPGLASGTPDPTDPAWLLLGEAAWMVELLSEKLDSAPLASLQHLVRLMGGQLLPATPALAPLIVAPQSAGRLDRDRRLPDQTRFFAPADERADAREFVLCEPGVSLIPAGIEGLHRVHEGVLLEVGAPWQEEGLSTLAWWARPPTRSRLFDGERIVYEVAAVSPEPVAAALRVAARSEELARVPWLRIEVPPPEGERVSVVVQVDPAAAVRRSVPGGLWTGGDLQVEWGTIGEPGWSPHVRIADDPRLRDHGQVPLPAVEGVGLVVRDVPTGYPLNDLLVRAARPLPEHAEAAIWSALVRGSAELSALRRIARRRFAGGVTPTWVLSMLQASRWGALARRGTRTLIPIKLGGPLDAAASLRVAILRSATSRSEAVELEAFSYANGPATTLPAPRRVWGLPAPPRPGSTWASELLAWDVPLASGDRGAVLVVEGEIDAAFVNALLVVNAPAVRDGRRWTVQRNVPEPISLLYQDVLTPASLARALEQAIPGDTAEALRALPLGAFPVDGPEGDAQPIYDLAGVAVDGAEGRLVLNAPDDDGRLRPLRPGARVRMDWYRRTDGAAGQVDARAIELVEQAPGVTPRLRGVLNPLPSVFGQDRERPEAAVERLFGPPDAVPALPTDLERLARQTLGARASGWTVRCWTWSERALVRTALWPLDVLAEGQDEREELATALGSAGPERVLFTVGTLDDVLSDEDLAWARRELSARIAALRGRVPTLRDAIVARLWPLTFVGTLGSGALPLPRFDTSALIGELRDAHGRSAPAPGATLLLNAIVVARKEAA